MAQFTGQTVVMLKPGQRAIIVGPDNLMRGVVNPEVDKLRDEIKALRAAIVRIGDCCKKTVGLKISPAVAGAIADAMSLAQAEGEGERAEKPIVPKAPSVDRPVPARIDELADRAAKGLPLF